MQWFRMFGSKYLLDDKVTTLPLECQGLLIRLWCLQCQNGHIPSNERSIASLTGLNHRSFAPVWKRIQHLFERDTDGNWYSKMLRNEMEAQKHKSTKNKENGHLGGINSGIKRRSKKEDGREANASIKNEADIDIDIDKEAETESENPTPLPPASGGGEGEGAGAGGLPSRKGHKDQSVTDILGGEKSDLYRQYWKTMGVFPASHDTKAKKTVKAWLRAAKKVTPQKLALAAMRYRSHYLPPIRDKDDTRYMLSPLKWLENEGYARELAALDHPEITEALNDTDSDT